jgi:hypothetical protein
MLHEIAQAFWLAAAVTVAGFLHMVVVKKDLFAGLKVPLDGGRTLGGERLFGDNKTWRGALFMIAAPMALGAAQGFLFGAWAAGRGLEVFPFAASSGALSEAGGYALVNGVLGLGYVLGELPNSFLKRRVKIQPGKTSRGALGLLFLVLDQADSVIAAIGLAALVFGLSLGFFLLCVVVLSGLHLAMNAGMHVMRLRKNL